MNDCKSVFNYNIELAPDGNIMVKDDCGRILKPDTTAMPPITKIINTRTVTITEAEGSRWIHISPPGMWIKV